SRLIVFESPMRAGRRPLVPVATMVASPAARHAHGFAFSNDAGTRVRLCYSGAALGGTGKHQQMASSQFTLLGERRFAPFFATQFLGAFNDNVFRNGLVILIIFQGVSIAGLDASALANAAGALFILPFFLFSALAGQ